MKVSAAIVLAALTSTVLGGFRALRSASPSRPHTAIIINPTAPPK
jgi:hypothetical protein